MSQSKSSKQWLKEHFGDVYVKRSQEEGYRSRASYKLLEMQEKDGFIKTGMAVVDLGAAPGGWSQVIAKVVGDRGSSYRQRHIARWIVLQVWILCKEISPSKKCLISSLIVWMTGAQTL